jgi:hypothetical protein
MTTRDEVVLLAYIKFFEQNIIKMNKLMEEGLGLMKKLPKGDKEEEREDYDGSMFG